MKTPLLLALALAGLLAGCAGQSSIFGPGHGLASGALYRQAEARVLEKDASTHPDSKERVVVATEVVTPPVVSATPYDTAYTHTLPDANRGDSGSFPVRRDADVVYSKFVERWTVRHGTDSAKYLVTYQPGPHNTAQIEVTPDP